MPLPIIASVHRNAISGTLGQGSAWANIIHTRWTGAGTPSIAQRQAMMDALRATWAVDQGGANTRILFRCGADTKLLEIRSTPLDGSTASLVTVYSDAGPGGSVGMPGGVALVATLRTALRGRSHRGRVYVAGINNQQEDASGKPTGTVINTVVNQFEATRVALLAISWELVVASYKLSSATVVATITCDNRWDSQRRRNIP